MNLSPEMYASLANRMQLVHRIADDFYKTFGKSILRFYHPFFGFDVGKFDDFLKVPDGISQAQHIRDKYGAEWEARIKKLF